MRTEILTITPEMAKGFLARNSGNRKLRKRRVKQLAGAMKRGEWMVTHQGIAFSPEMDLLDGQHRLSAISESGVPVQMLVSWGVDPATFQRIDVGMPRSVSDALKRSPMEVAIAKQIFSLRAYGWRNGAIATTGEVDSIASEYEEEIRLVNDAIGTRATKRSSASIRTAVVARIARGDKEYVLPAYEAFAKLVLTGMPPSCGSLLKQIDRGDVGGSGTNRALDTLVKAWLAFDKDRRDVGKVMYVDRDRHLIDIRAVFAKDVGQ